VLHGKYSKGKEVYSFNCIPCDGHTLSSVFYPPKSATGGSFSFDCGVDRKIDGRHVRKFHIKNAKNIKDNEGILMNPSDLVLRHTAACDAATAAATAAAAAAAAAIELQSENIPAEAESETDVNLQPQQQVWMLYAVCCMLFAVCCMLYATCCMLYSVHVCVFANDHSLPLIYTYIYIYIYTHSYHTLTTSPRPLIGSGVGLCPDHRTCRTGKGIRHNLARTGGGG
jgi:hypothetical protein